MSHPNREQREIKAIEKISFEEKSRLILSEHNKKNKKKVTRKKKPEEIIELIHKNHLVPSKYVRDPYDWFPKSYNLDRQKADFIEWIYCLYPVPQFMFKLFTHTDICSFKLDHYIFFDWFIVIAQGGSFAKCSKELFTKKEAHLFLNAPKNNTVKENFWWAKCSSLKLPHSVKNAVIKRLFGNLDITDSFWHKLLVLLRNCEDEVNVESLSDIMDFLRAKHAPRSTPAFSLKGRTFNSLIKLSNEWHREMQLRKFGSQNLYWPGADIPNWKWTSKKEQTTWKITQLHTSKELYNEGRRMKHCVGSYGSRCVEGASAIFSLTKEDGINPSAKRVTIEITKSKRFVQARGRMNQGPKGMDKLVINKWLSINNIQTNSWGW